MEAKPLSASSTRRYESASLIEPAASGYILVAAEVDKRSLILPASARKHVLLRDGGILCRAFERAKEIRSANLFDAILVPPVRSGTGRAEFRGPRFDVVALIETVSMAAAQALRAEEAFSALERRFSEASGLVRVMLAGNVRRLAPVDHERPGVFLFNYLHLEDLDRGLVAWESAAGWFQEETGLDNGTLLRPLNESGPGHMLVDHCRWDHWWDILPYVVLKRTFRSHVHGNFQRGGITMWPVFYRLV